MLREQDEHVEPLNERVSTLFLPEVIASEVLLSYGISGPSCGPVCAMSERGWQAGWTKSSWLVLHRIGASLIVTDGE